MSGDAFLTVLTFALVGGIVVGFLTRSPAVGAWVIAVAGVGGAIMLALNGGHL